MNALDMTSQTGFMARISFFPPPAARLLIACVIPGFFTGEAMGRLSSTI
jgi:hypothetical protein